MSHSDAISDDSTQARSDAQKDKRRLANAIWAPFLQFRLLMYMLGSTALVALLLGAFLYFAFNDLIAVINDSSETTSYYGEMIEIQLINLVRYCGALFILYILLLAAVCVTYTHRLVGPLRPFTRQVEAMIDGNYRSRITLRKGDLQLYNEYADKLNQLAEKLDDQQKAG